MVQYMQYTPTRLDTTPSRTTNAFYIKCTQTSIINGCMTELEP